MCHGPSVGAYGGGVRGLLIVNLHATTTSPRVTDVLVHALADEIDLEVVRTEHRGHARELGERARRERLNLLCTLGGDGTVNEAVNGALADGPGPDVPDLVIVPGGSANVVARSLGLPADPVEATGEILEALRADRRRRIGLGLITAVNESGSEREPQWFLANAGMGIDAEIIEAMERARSTGHEATPTRYLLTTLQQFFLGTNRRHPALRAYTDAEIINGIFLAIIQNSAPWTYLGGKAINPCPDASFESGLDLFAVRRLSVAAATRIARRMLAGSSAGSTRRSLSILHNLARFTLTADPATALQIDGEGIGKVLRIDVQSVPDALSVVC